MKKKLLSVIILCLVLCSGFTDNFIIEMETGEIKEFKINEKDNSLHISMLGAISSKVKNPELLDTVDKIIFYKVQLEKMDTVFWEHCTNIKKIHFLFTTISDFEFFKYLNGIEAVLFEECFYKDFSALDFTENNKLKYFEIDDADFSELKEITGVPKCLQYFVCVSPVYREDNMMKPFISLEKAQMLKKEFGLNFYLKISDQKDLKNYAKLIDMDTLERLRKLQGF